MIGELKYHFGAGKASGPLGPLELCVMEVIWERGESAVRDVVPKLSQPLAYTTVMTTLDRLYKKGLLVRRKDDKAFLYASRLSREDMERQRAHDLVAGFFTGPEPFAGVLISCLVDVAGQHDEELLNQLEEKIRIKREELERRKA